MQIDLNQEVADHLRRVTKLAEEAELDDSQGFQSRASAMSALTAILTQLTKSQESLITMQRLQETERIVIDTVKDYLNEEQLTHVLDGTRGQALPSGMSLRIQKVSEQLAMQRDNLARVAALVDRQVASVLPPADNASTYGKAAGVGNGSGAAARIYRSAG